MKIIPSEEKNKKTFSITLPTRFVTSDQSSYTPEDITEILEEKYNLKGYSLTSGTKKISSRKGIVTGTYVFEKLLQKKQNNNKIVEEDNSISIDSKTKTKKLKKEKK